jgi:purine-binding chemotaxis protein CheW
MTPPGEDEVELSSAELVTDWQRLRDRLARLQTLDDDSAEAVEARRRVLHERAKLLSQREQVVSDEGRIVPVLEFTLGDERYAVDATAVREVCHLKTITPVPSTPDHVAGVMAVRGRIVSVVDLSVLVAAPACTLGEDTMGIVLQADDMEFAVAADTIIGLRTVSDSSLQVDVSALAGARRSYLLGVTENRTAVLDARRLLGDETLVAVQQGSGVQTIGGTS